MNMFSRRKKTAPAGAYDHALFRPAIRSSICTGEKVAGFKELSTGRFREVMLLRDERDLAEFRQTYGIEGPIDTVY